MTTENQTVTGASSNEVAQAAATTPPVTTTPLPPTAKVEVKDGAVVVDGRKYVAESDLIANKKSLEGRLEQQQTIHGEAIDKAKLEVSASQQEVANLNAKLKENEAARLTGAVSDEDAAKVKQELETSKTSLETANSTSLEYRRALLVLQYGVASDAIKDKTMTQLDSFEEALKTLSTAKGNTVGPYAIGSGSTVAVPMTEQERAAKILEATPVRGVRNAVANP